MSEAPRLNSATDATTTRYASLSGLAVAAAVVAAVFVVVLLLLGWQAYSAGRPLLEGGLFLLPAVGVMLAFIARRQIRNSEGARTGEAYANLGWWVCVVVGACYLAYWMATEFAIRADAERVMYAWADKFTKANPIDPNDKAAREGFRLIDPNVAANPRLLQAPQPAAAFAQMRNSPLLLLFARNPDATLVPQGLRNWQMAPDGNIGCEVAATIKCAEGEFPVVVPMQATNSEKGRLWQVQPGQKFLDLTKAERTRYGWLIDTLEQQAKRTCEAFVGSLRVQPSLVPVAQSAVVDGFITGKTSPQIADALLRSTGGRQLLVGGTTVIGWQTDPGDAFFARLGGAPMTDDEYERADGQKARDGLARLRGVWEQPAAAELAPAWLSTFTPPQAILENCLFDLSDKSKVVVRVPIEFLPPPTGSVRSQDEFHRTRGMFASGYLVMVCDDPTVMAELNAARGEPGRTTRDRPEDLRTRRFPLRVVRLESELVPLGSAKEQPNQEPGRPDGMPPG